MNEALTESIEECDWYIATFSDDYRMTPELKLVLLRAIMQRKNELQSIKREEEADG